MDALALFNAAEATVWFVFGGGLLVATLRRGPPVGRVAGVAFLCFGVSDLAEISTGAWFRPWWLLLWKAACVLVLLGACACGASSGPADQRSRETELLRQTAYTAG